jgi:hypothetical protein
MLINDKGQKVKVSPFAKQHELAKLREVFFVNPPTRGGMFSIEARARLK